MVACPRLRLLRTLGPAIYALDGNFTHHHIIYTARIDEHIYTGNEFLGRDEFFSPPYRRFVIYFALSDCVFAHE